MGLLRTAIFGAILAIVTLFFISRRLLAPADVPKFPETWWKPGNEKIVDQEIRPFNITFSKKMIEDLKSRLRNTREIAPPLANVGSTYGANNVYLAELIDHWVNKYDFTKRERLLNRYPHYITNIQGLNIHYIHAKAKNIGEKRVVPLLLLHGWPGSIVEFNKIIPYLTTPRNNQDFVFEVIVPSLPGYGYSDASTIPGLGHVQVAIVMKNLMLRLGFDRYYVQGGDWGSFISNYMSAMFPQHVLGMHSNMCASLAPYTLLKTLFYSIFPSFIVSKENYHLMYPLSHHIIKRLTHSGYFFVQATRPDTIGVALCDSPAGLASWILDKFAAGASFVDEKLWESGLYEKFPIDELIDNIMVYWSTNSITTAGRLYAESVNYKSLIEIGPQRWPIRVPSACAQFPNEIVYQPESFLKDQYLNLVRLSKMPRGGHFAAMEEPKLLADDIWESVKIIESNRKEKSPDL